MSRFQAVGFVAMATVIAAGMGELASASVSYEEVSSARVTVAFNRLGHGRSSSPEVWLESTNGGERHQLTNGFTPLVSPSGKLVAVSAAGGTAIYTVGGRRIRFFPGSGSEPLAWAPDSNHLALVRQRTTLELEQLIVAAADSGHTTVIGYTVLGSRAIFSPDGRKLVYAHGPATSNALDIYIAAITGGSRRLTFTGQTTNPVWGPTANTITFARRGVIWTLDLTTHALKRLTGRVPPPPGWTSAPPGWGGLTPVAWSADGSRLLAEGGGEDTCVAYAVDPRTGRATVIGNPTPGKGDTEPDAISRDGRYALVSAGGDICGSGPNSDGLTILVRFDLETKTSVTLAVGGWGGSWNE